MAHLFHSHCSSGSVLLSFDSLSFFFSPQQSEILQANIQIDQSLLDDPEALQWSSSSMYTPPLTTTQYKLSSLQHNRVKIEPAQHTDNPKAEARTDQRTVRFDLPEDARQDEHESAEKTARDHGKVASAQDSDVLKKASSEENAKSKAVHHDRLTRDECRDKAIREALRVATNTVFPNDQSAAMSLLAKLVSVTAKEDVERISAISYAAENMHDFSEMQSQQAALVGHCRKSVPMNLLSGFAKIDEILARTNRLLDDCPEPDDTEAFKSCRAAMLCSDSALLAAFAHPAAFVFHDDDTIRVSALHRAAFNVWAAFYDGVITVDQLSSLLDAIEQQEGSESVNDSLTVHPGSLTPRQGKQDEQKEADTTTTIVKDEETVRAADSSEIYLQPRSTSHSLENLSKVSFADEKEAEKENSFGLKVDISEVTGDEMTSASVGNDIKHEKQVHHRTASSERVPLSSVQLTTQDAPTQRRSVSTTALYASIDSKMPAGSQCWTAVTPLTPSHHTVVGYCTSKQQPSPGVSDTRKRSLVSDEVW